MDIKYFKFHFEGQCLLAHVKDEFIHRVFLIGENIELNITDDIARAFSLQYKGVGNVKEGEQT